MSVARVHVLRLDRRYVLPAATERVWARLSDLEAFPEWWRWLRDFEVEGDGLTEGTRLTATVAPPVPYRFPVTVRFHTVEPPHRIDASLSGGLTGPATLRLTDHRDGCEAHVRWEVEMQQPLMRRWAYVARPAMVWGHDQVVASTVRRFRSVLQEPR